MSSNTQKLLGLETPRNLVPLFVSHRWLDVIILLIILIGWIFIDCLFKQHTLPIFADINTYPKSVPQIFATVSATLAGFTLTSISILLNISKEPGKHAAPIIKNNKRRKKVVETFVYTTPHMALTFISSIICLTSFNDELFRFSLILMLIFALCSLLGIFRIFWTILSLV